VEHRTLRNHRSRAPVGVNVSRHMNLARPLISAILTVAVSCATAAGRDVQEREIKAYPFIANSERAAALRNGYKRIALGMTPLQVAAVLGEPDEIRALYEPNVKNGKLIGYTHWYVIRRMVKTGSEVEKQESLVRVSFELNDRVSKIDAWGL